MRKLSYYHGFAGLASDVIIDLAEKLINMAPVPMSKVLYANSGSEANDLAIKLVWYYQNAMGRPKKKKIISRVKGYHGITVMTAGLTGLPHLHGDFDLPLPGIKHTMCPHHYRFAQQGESEEDFATRCADALDKLIQDEGPDTVGAFIAEPVQGAGGVIVPPKTYFEKVQKVLKKHEVLFICDEVICGFGRTGNMFGTETFKLKPDMISVAKALTSAYVPMSALMVAEPIFNALVSQSEKLGVFGHGSTYGGHPVAAAVALETLKIYEEKKIVDHVRKVGPRLQMGLRKLADHPLVGDVRGLGLIAGVEMVKNKKTKEPFDPKAGVGVYLAGRARANGVISRCIGETFAFSPPLVINEGEIDELLAAFGKSLDETHKWVKDQGLQ